MFVYFALRLVWLAFHVDPALPPDETTHAAQARHARAYWGAPADTPQSWPHGLLSHRPFLYAWAMARWLALEPTALAERLGDLVWMRLANIALALGAVAAALGWARRAGADELALVCICVVLTNLPMWSFLSASVNYDNGVIALAMLAFWLLARALDEHSPTAALGFALALCAGVLTKVAFVPLAALLALAALATIAIPGAGGREVVSALARSLRRPAPRLAALALAVTLLGGGAIALYGANLLRYGVLEPAANQVLPLEAARRNRIFEQEYVLRSYRAGAIDYREARREIRSIEPASDRAGALWLLERARARREAGPDAAPLRSRLAYAPLWLRLMGERIFGVMGHRALYKQGALAAAYGVFALLALAALVPGLRGRGRDVVHRRIAVGVAFAYALILMQGVNYPIYWASGLEVEAVQGRYLLPVLPPLLASALVSLLRHVPARTRTAVAVVLALFFIAGDFPYFLAHADVAWFAHSPCAVARP